MTQYLVCFLLSCLGIGMTDSAHAQSLPAGFVYVDQMVPDIRTELSYRLTDNFVGATVDGYAGARAMLTQQAAQALGLAQAELRSQGLGLLIFDAYRPQRAVNHFARWAKDLSDTAMKQRYYPEVEKTELFSQGYIAARSGHSRGSTVDLTLVSLSPPFQQLDMGTVFDFFSPKSWLGATGLTAMQEQNRALLQRTMKKYGFTPYSKEWWHFTLEPEPFPDTYFDFEIRDDLSAR
ncbi:MAG: M15 family metallopeptidase [Burkholderiaceae bacterium]|nr:M15 family metallopeptidase [Burkholderiaceae bacterium]